MDRSNSGLFVRGHGSALASAHRQSEGLGIRLLLCFLLCSFDFVGGRGSEGFLKARGRL